MGDNAKEELTNDEEKVTKKTSKKWVIITALIVCIIGLFLIFIFSPYKLLFSPKKMSFLNYMTKDVTEIKNIVSDMSENDLIKILSEGNKKIDFNLNFDMKNLAGTSFINGDFVTLKLNGINEHDLLLENKNLDAFWPKIGFEDYELPSEINFEKNPLILTKAEKRKISNFVEKCIINVLENLSNENFSENSQKSIDIDNKEIGLKTIEMELSEYDLLLLQKEVLRSFEKEGMLQLVVNKINSIGLGANLDKKELKETLEKEIAYIDLEMAYNDLQEQDSEYFLIYRMYYDEANNVVARELTEKYTYEGQQYEDIIVRLISNGNYYELKLFNQEEDYSGAYYNIISDTIKTEDNVQNHNITFAVEGFYVGYSEDGSSYEYIPLDSSINYNLAIEKLETDVNVVTFSDENNTYMFNLQYDSNNANTEFKNDEMHIKVDIANDNMTKDELISNGAVLLNEKTQEEIMTEINNIESNISELFAE